MGEDRRSSAEQRRSGNLAPDRLCEEAGEEGAAVPQCLPGWRLADRCPLGGVVPRAPRLRAAAGAGGDGGGGGGAEGGPAGFPRRRWVCCAFPRGTCRGLWGLLPRGEPLPAALGGTERRWRARQALGQRLEIGGVTDPAASWRRVKLKNERGLSAQEARQPCLRAAKELDKSEPALGALSCWWSGCGFAVETADSGPSGL